jgi:F-type H+-transporting ATPase subunit a
MDAETARQVAEHAVETAASGAASPAAEHMAAAAHQAASHAAAAHGAAGHAAGAHGGIPELPNFVTVLNNRWHDHPLVSSLHQWENLLFAALVGLFIASVAWRHARRPAIIPQGGQNLLELLVDGIDRFVRSIAGPGGRKHTPFIGTLFLYIWLMNLSSLVPGFKPATSSLNTTIGLALVVFGYVQWTRIRELGPAAYLDHMAGSPRFDDLAGAPWPLALFLIPIKLVVAVLLFILELLGEFIKPISLSLRLGFNVFAEDVLLAVLVGLGIGAGLALHLPTGLPIQLFVVPLVLIFSTVQALVFSLLSTVYISLMSPHHAAEHH